MKDVEDIINETDLVIGAIAVTALVAVVGVMGFNFYSDSVTNGINRNVTQWAETKGYTLRSCSNKVVDDTRVLATCEFETADGKRVTVNFNKNFKPLQPQ